MNKIAPEQWKQVFEWFDVALGVPIDERETWIERFATNAPELKAALRNLLAGHAAAETNDYLDNLPQFTRVDAGSNKSVLAHAGDRIGPYQLLRELGRGGMGTVWLAERVDGKVNRKVALKLPHINWGQPDLAARMARERDILAQLEHPNIARLYDADVTELGQPYLVLEYVEGIPINEYCDRHKLSVRERLGLFVQVLEAVQYAHTHLVVHRDLKPSNILINADGRAQLLDFGVAKLIAEGDSNETMATQFGARALTPDYASPEQILEKPITTTSDIYSLGVVLHELLTGARPYRLGRNSHALEQAIVEADVLPMSRAVSDPEAAVKRSTTVRQMIRTLKGDIDTIVRKALQKESHLRYSSIDAFQQDIQRYLDGHPISARPASLSYKVRRFVSRNRVPVAATAAVVVALVAGSIVALSQAQQARTQALRANEVKRYVLSIFEEADTDAGAGRSTTAVELLTEAHRRLQTTPVKDPAIQIEILSEIGFSLIGLGDFDKSKEVLREAVDLSVRTFGSNHPQTAKLKVRYGEALLASGETAAATQWVDEGVQGLRQVDDSPDLVAALGIQAGARRINGDFESAIALSREAVQMAESRLDAGHKRDTMEAYRTLAICLQFARKPGALDAAERAQALARDLFGDRIVAPVLEIKAIHAVSQILEGDAEQGIAELRTMIPQQIELLGEKHGSIANSYNQLGIALTSRGEPLAAADAFRKELSIRNSEAGDNANTYIAVTHRNLGAALISARRYAEAEEELRQAEGIFIPLYDENNTNVVGTRVMLARALLRRGQVQKAEEVLAKAIAKPIDFQLVAHLADVARADLFRAQGHYERAEPLLRSAIEYFSQPSADGLRASTLAVLGNVLLSQNKADEALAVLEQADDLFKRLHPHSSPDHAAVLMTLSQVLRVQHRKSAAAAATARAVAYWREFDPENTEHARALMWHAQAQADLGDAAAAQSAFGSAVKLISTSTNSDDRALLEATRRVLQINNSHINVQARPN